MATFSNIICIKEKLCQFRHSMVHGGTFLRAASESPGLSA